jgi:hypothetical protein
MKWFENKSIETHPLKPKLWKIFANDTYIIWPHVKENLDRFKDHLNR